MHPLGQSLPPHSKAVQNSTENTWNIMARNHLKKSKKEVSAWPKIGQMLAVLMEYDVLRPAERKTTPVASGIS